MAVVSARRVAPRSESGWSTPFGGRRSSGLPSAIHRRLITLPTLSSCLTTMSKCCRSHSSTSGSRGAHRTDRPPMKHPAPRCCASSQLLNPRLCFSGFGRRGRELSNFPLPFLPDLRLHLFSAHGFATLAQRLAATTLLSAEGGCACRSDTIVGDRARVAAATRTATTKPSARSPDFWSAILPFRTQSLRWQPPCPTGRLHR